MTNPEEESRSNGYGTLIEIVTQLGRLSALVEFLNWSLDDAKNKRDKAAADLAEKLKQLDAELKRVDIADSRNFGHEARRNAFLSTLGLRIAMLQDQTNRL